MLAQGRNHFRVLKASFPKDLSCKSKRPGGHRKGHPASPLSAQSASWTTFLGGPACPQAQERAWTHACLSWTNAGAAEQVLLWKKMPNSTLSTHTAKDSCIRFLCKLLGYLHQNHNSIWPESQGSRKNKCNGSFFFSFYSAFLVFQKQSKWQEKEAALLHSA